jgi:UDP-glucose 4-epimerase
MANAIITGGAGFIASHLAEAIENKYDNIYLIDNLVRTNGTRNIDHLSDKFKFIEAEVSEFDFSSISNVEVIYHLAATRINRCAKDPAEGHKLLADAGFNVVKYCAENNIKLFFASTASVYNNPKRFPIEETDPCEPHTLYGAAKYYTEGLMRSFAKNNGLQYSICRFFSVYGVRMDCEGAYTEIIFNWLNNINRGENKVTVFGNPDEKVLDLVYVKDVVAANIHALDNYQKLCGSYYEVGLGQAHSFEDVLDNLGIAYSYTSEQAIPKGYQFYTCCNKYKWMPGWEPKFTLQTGLIDYKSNHFISGGIGQFSDASSMLNLNTVA